MTQNNNFYFNVSFSSHLSTVEMNKVSKLKYLILITGLCAYIVIYFISKDIPVANLASNSTNEFEIGITRDTYKNISMITTMNVINDHNEATINLENSNQTFQSLLMKTVLFYVMIFAVIIKYQSQFAFYRAVKTS